MGNVLKIGDKISYTVHSTKGHSRRVNGILTELLHYSDKGGRVLRVTEYDAEHKAYSHLVAEWYTHWIEDFKVS